VRAKEWTIKGFLNLHYGRFGKMTELKINPDTKTIEAQVQLKGESEPIRLTVTRYTIDRDELGTYVEIGDVSVSRQWMELLAKEALIGKRVRLPAAAAKLLGMIL
jgi:hypothetical protein